MKKLFPTIPTLKSDRLCLRKLSSEDADDLFRLTRQPMVYRYLPTFLFEKKYKDIHTVIRKLYDECLNDSLILGIFLQDEFCGLGEMYGYREPIHKISVGYRLLQEKWGQGIASESLRMMTDELLLNRGIEIITASTMVENQASAHVLLKIGFTLVVHAADEDWGYDHPTLTDKWIR